MAVIGFLALLAAGGYLIFVGLGMAALGLSFSGRAGFGWLLPVVLGSAAIYLAVSQSPVTVAVKW